MNEIKIGCGWWGFREKQLKEHLEICNHFGFKAFELGIGNEFLPTIRMESNDADLEKVMQLTAQHSVATPWATIENDFTYANRLKHDQMVEHALATIQIAKQLNVKYLRLFAGFAKAEDINTKIYQQVIEAFAICAEKCQLYDIQISIETHGQIEWRDGIAFHHNTISTDPIFLEKMMKDLPVNVGFNYDPGNIKAVRPDDKGYCLDILNDRINYCHLKDWKRKDGGWVAAAIGEDDIDYQTLIPRMKFDGTFLIEYEPLDDLTEGIQRSVDYLSESGFILKY